MCELDLASQGQRKQSNQNPQISLLSLMHPMKICLLHTSILHTLLVYMDILGGDIVVLVVNF